MNEQPATACYVQEIGTAVPEFSMAPKESVELFQQTCGDPRTARLLPRIVKLTGIEKRHLSVLDPRFRPFGTEPLYRALDEQPRGPGMGARTAVFEQVSGPLILRALSDIPSARLAEVDALITASCTHASAPGLERSILAQTPVRPSVHRWNLGFMGCSAGLAAVRMVHQMAERGANALVVTCELSSLHFQYTNDLDQLTANVLFADGAAAVTISPRRAAARIIACRCASLPQYAEQMVWFADDHGLRLRLSQDLPDTLAANVPATVEGFLRAQGTSVQQIHHWLVHPGGPQILEAVQESLGLPEDSLALSRSVLRRYGNMSSPTIFFILKDLLETKVDGRCVAMAFGPGLTVEMVLLDIYHGKL
ncbi:MAG TPA: type III polyketide synthase [Phycisphaerae bacterium]|nr:type III polyketide synthase [Phycisphaerae bacterium]